LTSARACSDRAMRASLRFCACVAALVATHAVAAPHVERFSPTGSIKNVRQVVARFSDPIVALGVTHVDAPFDVDCAAAGTGRWVDMRNWVFDFADDLPGGVACRFMVKKDLRALTDAPVAAATFAFDTGGPSVRALLPEPSDRPIDEEPVFLAALDA